MYRTISCYLFFLLTFLIGGYFLAEKRLDGFRVKKILLESQNVNSAKIFLSQEEKKKLLQILSQKFTYLNRGRQSFVFESEDKKYVLKFLKNHHVCYPKLLRLIPIDALQRALNKKDEKAPRTFQSIDLSYQKLRKETALLYAHGNRKEKFHQKVILYNKCNVAFEVELDATYFMLQKKLQPFYSTLHAYYQEGGEEKLKQGIDAFFVPLFSRCRKKMVDDDLEVEKNYGFFKKNVFLMDFGRLFIDERLEDPFFLRKEMIRSSKFFINWIIKYYPSLLDYVVKKIEKEVIANTCQKKSKQEMPLSLIYAVP